MRIFRYIFAFLAFFSVFVGIYILFSFVKKGESHTFKTKASSPINKPQTPASPMQESKTLSIALLGIDRRSREEAFRTDVMIVVAVNKETNRVVMVSIPRDLWWKDGRINATYIQHGWPALQEGLTQVTGIKPEKFILTDFKDFSWLVDAMGGVPVEVETTFTDTQYPVDETFEYQTVSFTQGKEVLTGQRALIFSRSRKGDNDNGDWGRMKRQHLILKGMLTAITQPTSTFRNMSPKEMLKVITTGKMDTNLTPDDAMYLWDLYKDKDKYQVESLYLDHDYLFTPPLEEYGGAWVLAPLNGTFEPFQRRFKESLSGVNQTTTDPTTTQTPEEAAKP
jgi:LCP family protein required for cell wall assembly